MKKIRVIVCALLTVLCTCALASADDGTEVLYSYSGVQERVSVRTLGGMVSEIETGTGVQSVPTSKLTWTTDADANHRLAYVYAPAIGRANLRKAAKNTASIVATAKAGRVVQVTQVGSKYCQVVYEGKSGYILTSTLRFLDEPKQEKEYGIVTYAGNINSKKDIHMRNEKNTSSNVVIKLKPGTKVLIWEITKYWAEIEIDGWHGFIRSTCVDRSGEYTTAFATPEPTPAPTLRPEQSRAPETTKAPAATVEPETTRKPDGNSAITEEEMRRWEGYDDGEVLILDEETQ